MSIRVETPPTLDDRKEDAEKIRIVMSYLFRLSENLNVALNNLTSADIKEAPADLSQSGARGGSGGTGTPTSGETYNDLRALIVNTANNIKIVEQRLREEYTSQYEALSEDWGVFRENVTHTVETTARDVVNSYGYDALISTLQSEAAGFAEYKTHTEGFIRQGFIDYDENGVPIIGIAIGQNLTTTQVTIDGVTYDQFDSAQSCAFYTADRVSFRINGQNVAYISNRKLYIGDAEITSTLTMGKWLVSHENGYTIKWIGG